MARVLMAAHRITPNEEWLRVGLNWCDGFVEAQLPVTTPGGGELLPIDCFSLASLSHARTLPTHTGVDGPSLCMFLFVSGRHWTSLPSFWPAPLVTNF
jgi:hypothetical protein